MTDEGGALGRSKRLRTAGDPPSLVTKALPLAGGVLVFGGYLIGSSRAFGYDSSVTMDRFVAGPPSWAFTRQQVWNNHHLFSFLESLAFDVLGGREMQMRVLPALFAALSVSVLAWRVSVHWGQRAALAGALVLATHPMLVPLAREVRGYSLAVLSMVVMGVGALDVRRPALFGAGAAVGFATHLYSAPFAACLVVWVIVTGEFDRRWARALAGAILVGALVHLPTLSEAGGSEGRRFRPTWPLDTAWELLGGRLVLALCLGVTLMLAASRMRWDRRAAWLALAAALAIAVPWIIAPADLYPRFAYWLVPAIAITSAWVARRSVASAVATTLFAVVAVSHQVPQWGVDELPNRRLAQEAVVSTCVAPTWPGEALRWYLRDNPVGADCPTGAVLLPERTPESRRMLESSWPAVCWKVSGAALRAKDPGACPVG